MSYINLDKSNLVYLVGLYCKKPGWNYLNQIRSVWIHIRIEKIAIIEFYFTNNHKQKRTNKQQTKRKEKNQNQAYIKVDLDLDDS